MTFKSHINVLFGTVGSIFKLSKVISFQDGPRVLVFEFHLKFLWNRFEFWLSFAQLFRVAIASVWQRFLVIFLGGLDERLWATFEDVNRVALRDCWYIEKVDRLGVLGKNIGFLFILLVFSKYVKSFSFHILLCKYAAWMLRRDSKYLTGSCILLLLVLTCFDFDGLRILSDGVACWDRIWYGTAHIQKKRQKCAKIKIIISENNVLAYIQMTLKLVS